MQESEIERLNQLELDFHKVVDEPYGYPSTPIKGNSRFSKYIVYVDESGDFQLDKVDKGYPVFVLAFCVFHKGYYSSQLVPEVQALKFNHFGHDLIVLHEREIRRKEPPFIFGSKDEHSSFVQSLSTIIDDSKFILIATAVHKTELFAKRNSHNNAYNIALSFCLETLFELMVEKSQENFLTHVVVESRGKNEDRELELEFRRICDGDNKFRRNLPFEILIKSKQTNSTGLQLADLVARPIGRHVLDEPSKQNRAFDVLKSKFYCEGGREKLGVCYNGFGLKIIK